ncbi:MULTISPECIES: anthranilate synthase component I [unclassified Curtobacterium]|uniref:anthranilate synthase component I n=1 Tax=unclassified Curtobacterium TaxID=257496 RepID=UPI00052A6A22|nr:MULTISPECIES: anthranilate synthase component I [unclassified Curtobacterium]AIV40244.1 anthranilate synthase [Curtobacterium sp. MR_MD2014]MBP1300219.1 anthranilate synthase component 1 [Curtobacterium sp. 1310]MDB6426061.1 anthranilate synthase component I [Curtobacterium sp. 20TX0008]MDT0209578.1 anthranilate synthase component I [Curtobacterium sp. BRD11]
MTGASRAEEPRTTSRQAFDDLLDGHRVVPVVRALYADSETPVGVYRKLADGRPGSFLLESAGQGGLWSRWSFVGVRSFGVLTQDGDRASWIDTGIPASRAVGSLDGAPLDVLARLHDRWATPRVPGTPPLVGGTVGFIGWEAVRQLEHLPNVPAADFEVPGQALAFVSELAALDHRTGLVLLVASVLNDGTDDPDTMWSDAQSRLDRMQADLVQPSAATVAEAFEIAEPTPRHRTSPEDYMAAVERSKDFIRDGDVFQVVVSQRFDHDVTADPLDVYRVLRTLNPSPYMYFLALADSADERFWIVGASPEALVKVQDGRAITHPIAGSRPRGASPVEDVRLGDELFADPKERAEHLMLVDLARNDLQKVCEPGTVAVTEFMTVERFSHIMHLVSSVEGSVRPGASAIDVFRATFPAGTLSGAPKPRALEIIDELEPAKRGAYAGVVGYFDFAGDADLAIAIRTALIKDGVARVQAGAGLVADSDPRTEHEEAVNKAAAPLRAVATANRMREVRA